MILSNKRFTVCLDWLTINFKGKLSIDNFTDNQYQVGTYKLILQPFGSRQFKYIAYLYSDDKAEQKIATFQFCPHSDVINDDFVLVQFDNWIFYDDGGIQWYYNQVKTAFDLSFNNVSRMDIALDGLNDLEKFFTGLESYEYELLHTTSQKKIKQITIRQLTETTRQKEVSTTYYLGKPTSGKCIKYYNKTKELQAQNGKKDYISAFHKNNGLVSNEDIKRLEMSITSKTFRKLKDFDFDSFLNDIEQNAFNLFHSLMYDIVVSSDNKRRSDNERVYLYDFTKRLTATYEIIKNKVKDVVHTVKVSIKNILKMVYASVYDAQQMCTMIDTAVINLEKFDLWQWLEKREHYWYNDFNKFVEQNNLPVTHYFKESLYKFLLNHKKTLAL